MRRAIKFKPPVLAVPPTSNAVIAYNALENGKGKVMVSAVLFTYPHCLLPERKIYTGQVFLPSVACVKSSFIKSVYAYIAVGAVILFGDFVAFGNNDIAR